MQTCLAENAQPDCVAWRSFVGGASAPMLFFQARSGLQAAI
ncbi:hypothetical protein [Lysobacter gummosus]